ncbi:hypothetical protein PIB30_077260 [Stylosanthes scabra]|uniref:Uncharacterized protein n=1 Tax=Stylosanthes scabra TaxID=79078 RepID=A0ABU6YPY4_9FABA|nr:hypothetical protein [Stylosanthes scabra]
MPHVKRPTKKSRGGSSSTETPPQDHPLTQWFYNKEDFDLYLSDFAPRKVVPPSGNHGLILDEDLEIMWRMVNGQQINWVHLIVTHMRRTKPGNSKGLPYAILWTAIFKYVGIDLSQADKKRLGYNHCIDTHVLNHMKRNVHEDPQKEKKHNHNNLKTNHSEQPSMNDMMQVLLRIEQNQANMGNRLERIERNQPRMLRKIRRVEAYTFSEDEAEDDNDDLD